MASVIKSIQRGFTNFSSNPQTITVSAVDVAKSELSYLGKVSITYQAARIVLTDSTTITATRSSSDVTGIAWELTEFF